MDPKQFEQFLNKIAHWHRPRDEKILNSEDPVDPKYHNPEIEILELKPQTYPCEWCNRENCTGRQRLALAEDVRTGKKFWHLYCHTCKKFYNPDNQQLTVIPIRGRRITRD